MLVADVGRLRTLVEELMELSRFDADAEAGALEPVELGQAHPRRDRGARCRPPGSSHPSPVVVDTDPRRLDRIVGNFLDNAREHAAGTDAEVELDPRREELVDRRLRPWPGRAARSARGHLRALHEGRPVARGGSSGLGLAIAAEHAALLGGYLRAMNRDGGGLRLELVLPLAVAGSLRAGDGLAHGGRTLGSITSIGSPTS